MVAASIMSNERPAYRAAIVGACAAVVYGLVTRWFATMSDFGAGFLVMTTSFILLVPLAIGYLTVYPLRVHSWAYRLLMPWLPTLAAICVTFLVGWEGSICILIATPLMLLGATIGGLLGWLARSRVGVAAVVLIPFAGMPLEAAWNGDVDLRTVESAITIDAPLHAVWNEVVSVPEIRDEERAPAFFTAIGFPRPLDATISYHGLGAVRHARFDRGVIFVETITDWQPARRLSFTIDAPTDSVQLDQHVTVGGPFFDVLTGTYTLDPLPDGRVRLRLHSDHRLSTRFNLYAALWTDAIMASIQKNILRVLKARAEAARGGATVGLGGKRREKQLGMPGRISSTRFAKAGYGPV